MAKPHREPRLCFPWNGELTDPPPDAPPTVLYTGHRVRRPVVIKRVPSADVDGAAIDHSLALSGWLQSQQVVSGDHQAVVRTLTCQTDRPGDTTRLLYVALEACDFSLLQFVRWGRHRASRQRRDSAASAVSGGTHGSAGDGAGAGAGAGAGVGAGSPSDFLRVDVSKPFEPRILSDLSTDHDASVRSLPPPSIADDPDAFSDERLVDVCWQLCRAVAFLHSMSAPWGGSVSTLFHGNLKPSNVLFRGLVLKLSELGNRRGRELADAGADDGAPDGEAPPSEPAGRDNALGWKAWHSSATGMKSRGVADDVFATGCLVFYILTLGRHPYGPPAAREDNIGRRRKPQLGLLARTWPTAQDLVARMLDTESPISVAHALQHPLFWTRTQRMRLILEVSEGLLIRESGTSEDSKAMGAEIQARVAARLGSESWAEHFRAPPGAGGDGWDTPLWHHKTPSEFERPYECTGYPHYALVRFIRNLVVHAPEHVRSGLFDSVDAVHDHVLGADGFPWLPVELWAADQAVADGRFTRLSTELQGRTRVSRTGSVHSVHVDPTATSERPRAAPAVAIPVGLPPNTRRGRSQRQGSSTRDATAALHIRSRSPAAKRSSRRGRRGSRASTDSDDT